MVSDVPHAVRNAEFLTASEIAPIQRQRFARQLSYVRKRSTFYNNLWGTTALPVSVNGLEALPLTDKEMLRCDLKLEMIAHLDLKEAILYCEGIGDYVSRELFEDILQSEEEHIDWLETQLGLIEKVGIQNYLQSAMEDPA